MEGFLGDMEETDVTECFMTSSMMGAVTGADLTVLSVPGDRFRRVLGSLLICSSARSHEDRTVSQQTPSVSPSVWSGARGMCPLPAVASSFHR